LEVAFLCGIMAAELGLDVKKAKRVGLLHDIGKAVDHEVEDLENIANAFPGVDKSYAVQAGRDLRIIVDSHKIKDDEATLMSRDIAKAIEEQLTYPGQIRVTVIRETRAVEYAK